MTGLGFKKKERAGLVKVKRESAESTRRKDGGTEA